MSGKSRINAIVKITRAVSYCPGFAIARTLYGVMIIKVSSDNMISAKVRRKTVPLLI